MPWAVRRSASVTGRSIGPDYSRLRRTGFRHGAGLRLQLCWRLSPEGDCETGALGETYAYRGQLARSAEVGRPRRIPGAESGDPRPSARTARRFLDRSILRS